MESKSVSLYAFSEHAYCVHEVSLSSCNVVVLLMHQQAVVSVQDETTFVSVQQAGQLLFSTPTYSAACTPLPKDEICSKTPDRGHSDLVRVLGFLANC